MKVGRWPIVDRSSEATGDDDLPYSSDLSGDFDAAWSGIGIDRQRERVRRLIAKVVVHPGRGQERIELTPRVPASYRARD